MDLLQPLNAAQRDAVTTTEGMVRVIAGAGSGKTRALSYRFAYLVNELGILPANILCVTFTNKSAAEMRQRIHQLTGDNDTGYINTFHGFCDAILREDGYAIGYPKRFLVLDNSDIDAMLALIYEERGLTLRDRTFSDARDMIEIQKLYKKPEYYKDMLALPLEQVKQKYDEAIATDDIIFYGYLYQEKKCFAVDYNDLIKFSLYIFETHPSICEKWQQRLEYIMIDEFQDIDELQYDLMNVLCAYHKNLFIVGDPDQTIYSWRGANVKYLLDFDKTHPGTKTIMMLENYRSTPEILACANSLIDKNKNRIRKNLVPMRPSGRSVRCHFADDQEAEAKWMAEEMKKLHEEGVPYRDMTVLYRAHYVTRAVEEVLLQEKIPYMIYSGVQFFSRMEVKDVLCYLRMIVYKDDLSFRRIINVPKRNLGKRRMAFLEEESLACGTSLYDTLVANLEHPLLKGTKAHDFVDLIERFAVSSEGRAVSDVLADLINASGYERMLRTEGSQERLDNLAELKQSVYTYETTCGEEVTIEHYLSHIALFTNADALEEGDKVKLMTIHAAKGLEFPYVFLCGMNDGIFPSRRVRTVQAMEEERRLAFVALTRAEEGLFLSEADGRHFDGTLRYPSRFLLDIDPTLLSFTQPPTEERIRAAKGYFERASWRLADLGNAELLKPGARVRHAVFGEGTVLAVDIEKEAHIIQFDGMQTQRAISFRTKLSRL